MNNQDTLQRFIFEDTDIRGELVHLDAAYQKALEKSQYPDVIRELLGEVMVTALLLSAVLKFSGKLSIQLQGGKHLSLLLVQVTHEQKFRGSARWEGELEGKTLKQLVENAKLVITIEPEQGNRYQGIVPIEGEKFSDFIEAYFKQSEQLPTKIWLAADGTQAAGLLIQKLPQKEQSQSPEKSDNDWNHLSTLAATIKKEELLSPDNQTLLYRLYHSERVRIFNPQIVQFACECSPERCERAIISLGPSEIKQLMEEQPSVTMNCEFCNTNYTLDIVDLTRLHKIAAENLPNA